VSDFLNAECLAVVAASSGDLNGVPEAEREALERHLNFARDLHIETRVIAGQDVAATLVEFARRNDATQIFLARPRERSRVMALLSRDLVQNIVNLAKDMQIVIVSEREPVAHG